MKFLILIISALLLGLVPTAFRVDAPTIDPADLVFKNGNIYTANESMPQVQAIAVKGDRIVFVGSNGEAQKYVGKATRVIDLHGNTVLPGLTDSHQHLSGVGFREMTLNLEALAVLKTFLPRSKREWIRPSPESGLRVAVGSKPTGSLQCFPPARTWIESHRTTL